MPDNDVVPRNIKRPWRKAARAAIARHPVEDVGDECRIAIAQLLRSESPPAAGGLARALTESAAQDDARPWERAKQEYLTASSRSSVAVRLVSEGDRLLEVRSEDLASSSHQDVEQSLIAGGLRRHAEAALWGSQQMIEAMVQEPGIDPAEVRAYETGCLDHAQIPELARRLATRDGKEIRAPATRAPRPDTGAMLDEEV